MQKKLYSTEDIAEMTCRSRSAVLTALHRGQLPQPVKVGRRNFWPVAEFDAWVLTQRGGSR